MTRESPIEARSPGKRTQYKASPIIFAFRVIEHDDRHPAPLEKLYLIILSIAKQMHSFTSGHYTS